MLRYKNLLIVGDKTHYIAMTFENIYKPIQYKYFDNFSNKGQYTTDTVNTLIVLNRYLAEIYKDKGDNMHYIVIGNKVARTISNGSYKLWVKTGQTSTGKVLDKEELLQWTIFNSLYKELSDVINIKAESYYAMKNVKYNKEFMAFTKELLNKAHKYIDNKKENDLSDICDLLS